MGQNASSNLDSNNIIGLDNNNDDKNSICDNSSLDIKNIENNKSINSLNRKSQSQKFTSHSSMNRIKRHNSANSKLQSNNPSTKKQKCNNHKHFYVQHKRSNSARTTNDVELIVRKS